MRKGQWIYHICIFAYYAQNVTLLLKLENTQRSVGWFGSDWKNCIVAGATYRVSLKDSMVFKSKGRRRVPSLSAYLDNIPRISGHSGRVRSVMSVEGKKADDMI